MMRRKYFALFLAALAGSTLASCGVATSGTSTLRAAGPAPSASPWVSLYPTPIRGSAEPVHYSIDWSNPLPGGNRVDPQSLASPAALDLPFAPFVPKFSGPASTAFVSDATMPQRAVLLVYQFTGDSRLPNPEVTLRETQDSRTDADLANELKNPPGDPADFSVRTIDGTTVLMIINGQQSRAQFLHGGLLFDITGPEVPAEVSSDLAGQILSQLVAAGGK